MSGLETLIEQWVSAVNCYLYDTMARRYLTPSVRLQYDPALVNFPDVIALDPVVPNVARCQQAIN